MEVAALLGIEVNCHRGLLPLSESVHGCRGSCRVQGLMQIANDVPYPEQTGPFFSFGVVGDAMHSRQS